MGYYSNMNFEMIKILDSAQTTSGNHQQNVVLLTNLYNRGEEFLSVFKLKINVVIATDYKNVNPFADRLQNFIALFMTSLLDGSEIEHPVFTQVFYYLLRTQNSALDTVRVRSCQLINKILTLLVGIELSDQLCDDIAEKLLPRLSDKQGIVRCNAVLALHRLQIPDDPDDPIILEYEHMMGNDLHAKVRQLCVEKIALRKNVIASIVQRLCDINGDVKLAACKRLSNIANILSIKQKQTVLTCALVEKEEKIRNYIRVTMLNEWLKCYENDFHKLMYSIRFDATEEQIKETSILWEFLLTTLFSQKTMPELVKAARLNEDKIVPMDQINFETIAFWRILVEYLRPSQEYEEQVALVLPELVPFCRYIKDYYKQVPKDSMNPTEVLQVQFVIKQMFIMARGFDISDSMNRKTLNELVRYFLQDTYLTVENIETVLKVLELIIPNVERMCHYVCEILSDIICPINTEEQIAYSIEIKNRLDELKRTATEIVRKESNAIENEDYTTASSLKIELERVREEICEVEKTFDEDLTPSAKKTDIPTVIKYLNLAIGLLLSPRILKLNPALETLQNDAIFELLTHENNVVRTKAMQAYGLCCVVNKASAKVGIHLFSLPLFSYQNGEECDNQTLIVCMKTVADLIRIYGAGLLIAQPVEDLMSESQMEEHMKVFTGGTSLTSIVESILELIDDESLEVQETAAHAICSLLVNKRIHSAILVSRLILKWCNPVLEDSQRLKQLIGLALEEMQGDFFDHDQWEKIIKETIRALLYAPRESPLSDVNVDGIAKFLLSLCSGCKNKETLYGQLATGICSDILNKPRSKFANYGCKLINMLTVPCDKYLIRDLLACCDRIRNKIRDKTTLKNIIKFTTKLDQMSKNVSVIEAEIPDAENTKNGEDENSTTETTASSVD